MKTLLAILAIVAMAGCTHLSKGGDFFHMGSAAIVLERMADGSVNLTVAEDKAIAEIVKTIRELAERGVIAP